MDRLAALSSFVAVARAGGFSAASRELGVPLPTISRRVADLEAELGVRLLRRSTRRVDLTDQGRAYFHACRRILEDLREAEASVTGEYRAPKGELALTAPVGFGRMHLQPVALEFLASFPDINLRLLLVDRVVNLLEEQVDAALRIAVLEDSALIARSLGHIRMVACASPDYLRRRGTPLRPHDLVDHECIAWSTAGPGHAWRFHIDGADATFPIPPRLSTTTAESATAAAEAGLGLAQVPCYQAERAVAERKLVVVLRAFECRPTPVNIVHSSQRLVPLKLRAFIDFAAPRIAERLSEIGRTVAAADATA